MKIKYMGPYNGEESSLPDGPIPSQAVRFEEPETPQKLVVVASVISVVILLVTLIPALFCEWYSFLGLPSLLGMLVSLILSIPHEYVHAICFRETAYIYTNWKQGMLFVVGPEDMSKARFIFMSLLPNILFGLIPYVLGFLLHSSFLTSLGFMSLSMGAGDYLNVWNAFRQMPKGSKTFLRGFHSWWYKPE